MPRQLSEQNTIESYRGTGLYKERVNTLTDRQVAVAKCSELKGRGESRCALHGPGISLRDCEKIRSWFDKLLTTNAMAHSAVVQFEFA
jgi:hypothetical protein